MAYFCGECLKFLTAILPVLGYLCSLSLVFAPWIVIMVVIIHANRIRAHCTEQVGAEVVSVRVYVGRHTYSDYGQEKYRVSVRYSYNGDTYTVGLHGCVPKKALDNARETGRLYVWINPKRPEECVFK